MREYKFERKARKSSKSNVRGSPQAIAEDK